MKNGFEGWLRGHQPDVLGLQEIKARPEQLEKNPFKEFKYHEFWHPADKPGYSGVASFSKKEPQDVIYGIGHKDIDAEGRVLTLDFGDYVFTTAYFPNSQREHTRLGFKLEFCDAFLKFGKKWEKKGKHFISCGDFNIAHKEIDLKNPKSNQKNAGFLPEERAWMTKFLEAGYVDTFRHFTQDPLNYTWWSYRPGVREKNVGWRIDYFCTDGEFKDRLKSAVHLNKVYGSDHCPVELEIRK